MRQLALSVLLLALPLWATAQLATLTTDAELPEFEEQLETYMTATKNERARTAYANFTGVFNGGGFTTEQQQRFMRTSVALAAARAAAAGGFADYLDLHEFLQGEERQELFEQFHAALEQLLAVPKQRINTVNRVITNSLTYLRRNRLDTRTGDYGWTVVGGRPSFAFGETMELKVDTVRQLLAIGRDDTLRIQETNLTVDLAEGLVLGKGGRTDWQRVGLPEEVFAILVSYEFEARTQRYKSDSAHLQYPDYFGDRILVGHFADQIQGGGARAAANTPQFVSDDGYVELKNVGEGINMFGNFELRGGTVFAIGDAKRRAQVTLDISDGDSGRSVLGRSQSFTIRHGESVSGQGVETVIFFEQDSLYHPSVSMLVDVPKREVSLTRTKSSSDQAPFYHSRNHFNIYADRINIYLDRDSAVVGKRTVSFQEKTDVVLESEDYYSAREYSQIQALASYNPLEIIYAYRIGPEGGNDVIEADALARRFGTGLTAKDIQPVLFELQDRGFLTYDPDTRDIRLNRKLVHYVESRREEKDFDKLRLVSQTAEINAFLDLEAGTIRVDGVKPMQFNREKQIAIKPFGDQVTVRGNRNLDFSGEVYAGGAVMSGKEFHFEYEPYHIKFDSVRYLDLFLPENGTIEEGMQLVSTGSRIEHVSGYLLIDAPKNKGGSEDIPYFPSIQSKGTSYIYYDQADTNAVYRRDSFFFALAPFSLNNVDSLVQEGVELDGRLVSGGIFPDMEETLSIQEDGSLGFITQTEEAGQTTYGERGSYKGEVTLSNRGLEGKGKLSYLEAEIDSEDLRFEMDKATASARQFNLEERATADRKVPQVRGAEVNITFKPYGDSLLVRPAGAPFEMFQSGEHTFDGSLVLTPQVLRGNGSLDWSRAAMNSQDLTFGTFGATADTANVQIKGLSGDNRLALRTTNVKADVNFDTQLATFENNSKDLATELPYNQFRTSIDRFDWEMAGGNITFQAQPGKDRFTSMHPDQDELTFTATEATYDINTSMLDVGGVPFVTSADAKIYPGDGTLRVEPGAKITQLTDARIVADTINEYHVINRATVDIVGRKEYRAFGYYEYNVGPHTQDLELQNIIGTRVGKGKRSEQATATRAQGTVAEGTDFYIDHKTKFVGTINLDAGSKNLYFEGYARIDAEKFPSAEWFGVENEGDKKNLTLDINKRLSRESTPLFTGFYLSKPNRRVYPSMIQTLDRRVDHPILDANGVFNYDEDGDRFLFGDSTRVKDATAIRGNLMVFDHGSGKITGDGMLGLGGRLKYVKMKAYGTIEMDLPPQGERQPDPEPAAAATAAGDQPAGEEKPESLLGDSMFILEDEEEEAAAAADSTAAKALTVNVEAAYPAAELRAMMAIDLILPPKLVQMIATDVASSAFSARELNIVSDQDFARRGLRNLFPAGKEVEQAIAGLTSDAVDLPKKLNNHTFLFTDMKMRWNTNYQSFVSTEGTNGLASIGGVPISRRIESYVEVKMTSGDEDRLYIYLKSPSEIYYFLGFKDGILNVVSNNTAFMAELQGMKAKDLVLKMDDGETYEILEVTPGTASTFLRRAQAAFDR